MPTYQYVCTACGSELEAVQSFSDEPLTDCPQCSGRLRKRFSAVGVVFKGSGFYKTDSRSGSSSRGPGRDGKEKADKEPAPAPAADKPAAATAPSSSGGSAGGGSGSSSTGGASSGSAA